MKSIDRETHRIAVISDTHNLLRPEILEQLKTCEVILHAGDIAKPEIIHTLEKIAAVYPVRGNTDKEWTDDLPKERILELYGFRIYMVHNKKHIRKDLSGIDIVVSGHSHKYEEKTVDGTAYLNPGSCGPRRFHQPVTMMVLTLYPKTHTFKTEKCGYSPVLTKKDEVQKIPEQEMDKLIRKIIKDMDAGRNVADIAAKQRVNAELAEQICRIYATHPGVDVQGILNRMEIKDM